VFWYPDGARWHLGEKISPAAPAAEANARAQAIEAGAGAGYVHCRANEGTTRTR
jgi:hypothetical protein